MKKNLKTKSKIILTASAIMAVLFGAVFFVSETLAGPNNNALGWLWGGTEQVDTNGALAPNNGVGDGDETSVGWVSMNNESLGALGSVSYGVNIPEFSGPLSGYAWSENIGWINFAGAIRSGNDITGSATIQGIADEAARGNSGGWLGRISLSGSNYGVSIDTAVTPNMLNGYGWSDELGWIDFKRATVRVCIPDPTKNSYFCSYATCGESNCGQVPTAICNLMDSCGRTTAGHPTSLCGGCAASACPACPPDDKWKEIAP